MVRMIPFPMLFTKRYNITNGNTSFFIHPLVPEGQSSPVLSHAPGPSVMIRWSEPTVTNGRISEYEILRRSEIDQSNISSVAKLAANLSTEYLDSSVVPCLRYHYRVIAFTKAGGGTPSPWSNITTQEGGELK